jgi:hypothetical protein
LFVATSHATSALALLLQCFTRDGRPGGAGEWDQAKPAGPVGICAIGVQGSAYK